MPVVDSKQQMLSIEDVLKIAYEETNEKTPFDVAYASVIHEFQDPNGTFLRYGNTIFIIHGSQKTPGTGVFRALNADTAKNYADALRQFSIGAYNKGYWLLVTKFRDERLIALFRLLMKNPPREGMGYAVKRTKDGQFQVTFTLGPKLDKQPEIDNQENMMMQQENMPMQQMPMQQMPTQQPSIPQGALAQLSKVQQPMRGV